MTQKGLTQLTDLEVNEVSFVDRGAIGEVFTVIKSEDENSDLINKYNSDEICNKLSSIGDEQFVEVMRTMMKRYDEINNVNKGGESNMNEDQVKQLITEVVGAAMDTVNKNFVQVNKAIDEIQKAATATKPAEEEEKKKANEEVVKAVNEIGGAVKLLADTVTGITKSLESLSKVEETVTKIADLKLDEQVGEISKRLENIEKQENPSNDASSKEDVNKNDAGEKTPFWKSFYVAKE